MRSFGLVLDLMELVWSASGDGICSRTDDTQELIDILVLRDTHFSKTGKGASEKHIDGLNSILFNSSTHCSSIQQALNSQPRKDSCSLNPSAVHVLSNI